MKSIRFLLLATLLPMVSAFAQLIARIPDSAPRATLNAVADGRVELGSRVFVTTPGFQIRDQENRILLPAYFQAPRLVRVLFDQEGRVQRIWILTAEEAAVPAPKL